LWKKKSNPRFEDVAQAVMDFINARQLGGEQKRIVEERRAPADSPTPPSHGIFDRAATTDTQNDPNAVRASGTASATCCAAAGQEGIDAAFAPLLAPRGMPDVPPELLQRLLSVGSEEELKALLEEHPELIPVMSQMTRQALSENPIKQAVMDFLEADDWAAGKRVVEERRDLLLTDEADQVFADLLEQARDDPQARRMLERHRDLLRRCRSEGVDAAFAPLLAPRGMPDVPPELLQRLLSVGSEEELKALLEEHPELLPLIGQMVQQALAGQSAGSGDDDELGRILTELCQPSRSALDMPRRVGPVPPSAGAVAAPAEPGTVGRPAK
jgi:hypothetical protein